MNRETILNKAMAITKGDREQDYGAPEDNFARIAQMWGAYRGIEFDSKDVAAMLALVKIARIASGNAKDDNWIDLAGYAACGGEIESKGHVDFDWNPIDPLKVTIDEIMRSEG